jgi:hypothetical protein
MSNASTAAINTQLTNYAQGLWNDQKDVVKVAERLAPSTPVASSAGQYKQFDDKNSFKPESTARALGGDPTVIQFAATDSNYNCKPQALETRVDKEEENQAGTSLGALAGEILDQGKIKALVNKSALSHAKDVTDFVAANTTPIADRGNFSNADIDPIEQIDEQLEALSLACGSTQNIKLTFDLATWRIIRNHPKVKARCNGVQVGGISLEQLVAMLLIPVDAMAANVVYDQAALGQAADKKRLLQGVLFAHYSLPNPTVYDPSAFKCFTVGQGSYIAGVRTYQAPNSLWRGHLMDWSRDIKKTSALAVRRLNIT